MKKKSSTSQSAFFNLRVLVGLFVALVGFSLALLATANPLGLGSRAASVRPQQKPQQKYKVSTKSPIDPLVPAMFDCSKIRQFGIDKQENMRAGAIMIHCGQAKGGDPKSGVANSSAFSKLVQNLTAPLVYGSIDVDLITGTETFPNVTQSETFSTANPDNPLEVVVAYNDSRGRFATPINISGASVSEDGGVTFTRLTRANGQSPFDNTFGDPVVLYNKPSGTWFTVWLDGACGGQGLGGYKSTTPSDPDSWTHFCAHTASFDDRESGWADNNPSSPFFGRMYVSWNDFNAGQNIFVTFSSDNGATWHSPVQVNVGATFIRNVQITGDLAGSGAIYIAGMDEGGGGFPHNDTNLIFKSIDGGLTWTNTYTGTPFPGPGVTAVGYFACMFSDGGGYWRHEGWGEPAAINNFVHLVYAQHGTGSDPGDVYYIRSTDGGVTFGTPFLLNTDGGTRPQWQPNLSVSPTGTLLATWYDARESASCTRGDPGVPCYRMFSRKSNDNGGSWLPDDTLSDVVSPLPAQPDPGIQATYAGDYDYGSAITVKHVTSWTDGRNAISGTSQQDAFTDRDLVGFSVITADPACGSFVAGTAPTDFVVTLSDPPDPATIDASDFTVNGTPADSFNYDGNVTITFTFTTSPVVQGENTMNIPAGAILQASNGDPILEFNCTFRYGQEQLTVTDTAPPVGGTFTPPAPGSYQYDVNWNIPVDPASVQTGDLQLSGNAGGTVTAVEVVNGNMTTRFTLNIPFGGNLTAHIAAGAITDTFGNPNADFSGSYTVEGCPPAQYTTETGTDTIIPGGTDIGNHCDDCFTQVNLPFPINVYRAPVSVAFAGSNGDLQLTATPGDKLFYWQQCVPVDPAQGGPFLNTLFPYYDDLRTDETGVCPDCGIFTQTLGTAPNRQFVIRWKTTYFNIPGSTAEFEVILTEGSDTLSVIYGATANNGSTAASGIQQDLIEFTSFSCFQDVLTPSLRVDYIPTACPSGTPTPTPTPTATPTATATATATPTSTPIVTPRPRPTPHPRPTPP